MLTAKQIADIIRSEMLESDSATMADRYESAAEKIHDLCKPDHDIIVAGAALENEVTSTLMDMLAATILATLIEQEGGGRTNISFSPGGMQEVLSNWTYTSEVSGMIRTVRIQPKNDDWEETQDRPTDAKLESLLMRENESIQDAKPQAEPKVHDRPVWAVRISAEGEEPYLRWCMDADDAKRVLRVISQSHPLAAIENRFCLHMECPTNRCNIWGFDEDNPGNGQNPDGN